MNSVVVKRIDLFEKVSCGGAGRSEVKGRNCGNGVACAALLENTAPRCIDGPAGQAVDLCELCVVKVDAIDQPKGAEAVTCARSIAGRGATNDAVELSFRVQDGNASGVAGVGVVALVVYGGEYFIVEGEGCHSVEGLREHVGGRSGEDLYSANSRMLGYFMKYVAKSIEHSNA